MEAPDDPSIAEARAQAAATLAEAEAQAEQLIEDAEVRARARADEVIAERQRQLDALLAEEREIRERIEELRSSEPELATVVAEDAEIIDLADARDVVNGIEVIPDSSLADFLKVTLRHEVRPD